jgi:hypothetical protein
VTGTAHRWLSTLVILVAASGCDNVSWGGIDVRLEGPPETESAVADTVTAEVVLPELPQGPVLFRVDRSAGRASLSPVGEISGDSLLPLSDEADFRDYFVQQRMSSGSEFVLFADGTRVGRFLTADSAWVSAETCGAPPVVSGIVELVPSAASTTRFLALPADRGDSFPRDPFSVRTIDQGTRVTAANIAGTVIMDAGTRWPPSMARARGDVQLLGMGTDEPALIAATYLYEDQMAISPPGTGAYSFFYLAEDRGVGHRFSYYWLRNAQDEGKGAARYFGHMDWDGDGTVEVLLEVLGAAERWHAALERTVDGWDRSYEDPCGAPERQVLPTG